MVNVIKLGKGLDLRLVGEAAKEVESRKVEGIYALSPDDFVGVTPKVAVAEGDTVDVGTPLFVNKNYPEVSFASPVSGTVKAVVRGARRKVLRIEVEADGRQSCRDFGAVADVSALRSGEVRDKLLSAGLFGFITRMPYAISALPTDEPRAVFVSAFRDMPLSADIEFTLKDHWKAFQTGLTALSRIAKTYVGVPAGTDCKELTEAKDVEVTAFKGKAPAGNVNVQIANIAPINKGEVVWTVDPWLVAAIGELLTTGKLNFERTVALVGAGVAEPKYVRTVVGEKLGSLLAGRLVAGSDTPLRTIDGNVLTGRAADADACLGALSHEVTVIPDGEGRHEMLGWIMPRMDQMSVSRTYLSWLMPGRRYNLDARVKGGERHIIMSGEYDRTLPMDIMAEYLVKAIIAEDIDRMEQLGIYEVAPEDFALAEFADSSKLPLQRIVRQGLDLMIREVGLA